MMRSSRAMRSREWLVGLVIAVLCLGATPGGAQEPEPPPPAEPTVPAPAPSTDTEATTDKAKKDDLTLESFAVPDAPAVAFINASPEQIEQPGSGRALLAQMLSNITTDGRVQQGFAVNSDLWYLLPVWAGGSVPRGAFRNPWGYAWSRLQVSLATVKTADSTTNDTDVAFGLRTTFFDESDLMRDDAVRQGIIEALAGCTPSQPPLPTPEETEACIDKAWGAATEKTDLGKRIARSREKWNANRLSLSAATGLRLTDSRVAESKWLGGSTWLNGSLGISDSFQFIAQARYDYLDLSRAHVLGGGLRANVGSPIFNLYAEALYRVRVTDAANAGEVATEDLDAGRWALGFEYRIMNQVWVSASLGSSFATRDAPERVSVLSTLKWNMGDAPRYSPKELAQGFDIQSR